MRLQLSLSNRCRSWISMLSLGTLGDPRETQCNVLCVGLGRVT